ncbi:MAG: ATP-grasp domain-containing protein [Chloroflexia bacterium]
MRILVVGLSTRACVESAVRSGYDVISLDAFGDLDLEGLCPSYSLRRDFGIPFRAAGLFSASRQIPHEALVYSSSLENYPAVVRRFAREVRILGNPAEVLARVRHWPTLFGALSEAGFRVPETIYDPQVRTADARKTWLRKPVRSGGGYRNAFWDPGTPVGRGFLLQEYLPGLPGSASFVANGEACVLIGLTEQLIGRPEMDASGFAYCGNILPLPDARDPVKGSAVLRQVREIARYLTQTFHLVGVNGFDFILSDEIVLLEVNPRYSASMELVEQAYGLPVFKLHMQAVLEGRLPDFDLAAPLSEGPFYGKAILYAREGFRAPDTRDWLHRGIRDVPHPGEEMPRGGPVCTLFATAPTRDACFAGLVELAETLKGEIYGELQADLDYRSFDKAGHGYLRR